MTACWYCSNHAVWQVERQDLGDETLARTQQATSGGGLKGNIDLVQQHQLITSRDSQCESAWTWQLIPPVCDGARTLQGAGCDVCSRYPDLQ